MSIFPELIRSNIPFILILLLAAMAFGAAWWLYRQTVPQISDSKKYVLGSLRLAVVFLVILLFFMPKLFLIFQEEKKEKIAVFVDNSLSMKIEDDSVSRWQRVLQIAEQLKKFSDETEEWEWYVFNFSLRRIDADSMRPSQGGTNFERLLDFIKDSELRKAVIISDGNYTEGGYPFAQEFYSDTKIYSVGVGKKSGAGDIFISDVQYEQFAYRGKPSLVSVEIGSRNLEGNSRVQLRLMQGGKNLASRIINLDSRNTFKKVELRYTPKRSGLKKLSAIIDNLPEETNTRNNRYTFTQEAVKSKINIAVFSGQAGFESKFIHFLLQQESDFISRLYVEDRRGRFIGQKKPIPWDSLDVLILQDYPGAFSRKQSVEKIAGILGSGKAGAVFYLGKNPNLSAMQTLKDFLPFDRWPQFSSKTYNGLAYEPQKNADQTLLNLFDDLSLSDRFWQNIPPVHFYFKAPLIKKNAHIYLECSTINKRYPVLISHRFKGNLFFTLLGEGFWKWHFLLQDEPELQSGYQTLLKQVVRRLANRSALKRVALESDNKTTNPGQTLHLKAHLYDAEFRRIKDGELILQARRKKEKFEIPAERDSSGRFLARLIPPGAGRYVIAATGYRKGVIIGKDSIEVEVIPMEKEFLQSGQNVAFLKKLAALGNGFYVSANGVDSLQNELKPKTTRINKEKNIELWYQPFLLILIIFIISLEWLLRKRWGLV